MVMWSWMMGRIIDLLIHELLVLLRGKDKLQFGVGFLHVLQSFCARVADLTFASKLEVHAV